MRLTNILIGLFASAALARNLEARGRGKSLAVYWGANDYQTTLDEVCSDDSYDIVNLAFLSHFFSAGGYPTLFLSPLNKPSAAQAARGATDLRDGTSLIPALQKCRNSGKKIFLAMGGAPGYSDVRLKNDDQGRQIANTLWNLFGGGTKDADLRPFGHFRVDGFDIDNETGDSTGYMAMIEQLRSNFATDSSRKYALSAAPGCGFPGDSITPEIAATVDHVWVQFYDTRYCLIGDDNFYNKVRTWSQAVKGKLYIGATTRNTPDQVGYLGPQALLKALHKVQAMGLPNYSGAMLWEAELAVNNNNYQKTIRAGI
ncbi:hypothetical protein NLG97_g4800 [Lecanicillium saksenae]|uniref:Uncharacterized protein n=1 Tax=Lecanicillium saksenae TaxID=468837 RepID=A0ACC1QWV0_9HYPO|nr:hypothetical protein NLG97_g4800 [Lecanicillium saksenae]